MEFSLVKYCLHPITKEKIPIWIANYVLDNYGTGVVMGVPAHDARDYDFAKKFNFKIVKVIDDEKILIIFHSLKVGYWLILLILMEFILI